MPAAMLWVKLALSAAFGTLIGFLVHVLWTPALGGTCTIICHPVRSSAAGALVGVAVLLVYRELTRDAGRCTIDEEQG
jgi:uncharacterized membrane protein YagU involved in acid resistance